jgi:hypothetical protein
MRLALAAPVALLALATCTAHVAPPLLPPDDLRIDLALAQENGKCVVRFEDTHLKDPRYAIAWTNHQIIWRVVRNGCGEKATEKANGKALGLRLLKAKGKTEPVKWFRRCPPLSLVPASFKTPPEIRCYIPSLNDWPTDERLNERERNEYEYEIDGDSVEPVDPGVDIRRNG